MKVLETRRFSGKLTLAPGERSVFGGRAWLAHTVEVTGSSPVTPTPAIFSRAAPLCAAPNEQQNRQCHCTNGSGYRAGHPYRPARAAAATDIVGQLCFGAAFSATLDVFQLRCQKSMRLGREIVGPRLSRFRQRGKRIGARRRSRSRGSTLPRVVSHGACGRRRPYLNEKPRARNVSHGKPTSQNTTRQIHVGMRRFFGCDCCSVPGLGGAGDDEVRQLRENFARGRGREFAKLFSSKLRMLTRRSACIIERAKRT